jgi:signal transduction histidine kinase
LRTPLAGIRNALVLIERKIPQSDSQLHEYMELIRQEFQTANQILTNCKDISQGRAPNKNRVELATIVAQARAYLTARDEIEWQFAYNPKPFMIYADAAQLEQVLKNLFINAAQALGGRGRIAVTAARSGQYDEIRVIDNGPGIPQQLREQIFEPLVTTKPGGTGLGLAICRQIVEQHGGSIEIFSGGDSGTIVQIRLSAG